MDRELLEKCTKHELIEKIMQLSAHVKQLQDIMRKSGRMGAPERPHPKRARDFNFAKHSTRHVAMKLLYLGWNYGGFVVQEDTNCTIESALFEALTKTKLIESRERSNYHRCGRTDRGVSAFSQVISIDVRTNLSAPKEVMDATDEALIADRLRANCDKPELNYALMLNNVLPPDIRVICWAPVRPDFSARFDCKARTYKYLFPIGCLDIERMRRGCRYLCGEHDFRNLCKMDVNNGVVNYRRKILSATLNRYNCDDNDNGYSMCELTITGQAFLWHQIRCIVAILFLIGSGEEEPDIIEKLLDVKTYPLKPQYSMAADFPLVLFDCQYSESDVSDWVYDRKALVELIKHMQSLWTKQMVKTDMIKLMLSSLESRLEQTTVDQQLLNISCQMSALCLGVKPRIYKPLLERPVCESLEQRILKANKRKKIIS